MSLQNARMRILIAKNPAKVSEKICQTYSVEEIRETPRVHPVEQQEALVYLFKTQSTPNSVVLPIRLGKGKISRYFKSGSAIINYNFGLSAFKFLTSRVKIMKLYSR
jgi:hypothetical protein